MRGKDLTGCQFGSLTVVGRDHVANGRTIWKCLCDCGNTYCVETSNLKLGRTVTCGCKIKDGGLTFTFRADKDLISLFRKRCGDIGKEKMQEAILNDLRNLATKDS